MGFGAQFLAHELIAAGHKVPEVVILDIDHLAFVPKLENYLFYQLFCSAAQDGIGAELGMMNRKIMAYERGGVRAAEADLEKRNEIVTRAKTKGFEPILTPAAPAFLSRRLTVLVLDEKQKLRVEELVLNAFIHRDQDYFARLIREFQGRHPELCHLGETAIARITESFARTRSFVSSPGLFFDPKTGQPCPDDVIRQEKLKAIIDIRVLAAGAQTVTKGAGDAENSLEISLEGGEVIISENAKRLRISQDALCPEGLEYCRWRPKGVGILNELLHQLDEVPKLINFGTGDALYVGSGEDFTNFAIVCRGRLFLLDPSERTIRNLTDLGLLERIEVIYLSHVHYDHIGGVLELALRFLSGASLPRFRLLTSRVVWLQTRDVLFATTGKDAAAFEDCFEVIQPTAIVNSAGQPDPDGDVEVAPLLEGAFRGFTCHLMRTYGHPLPTYALKCVTPHGTVAYLVDSTMPPASVQGQRNARHDDFLNFFDVRANVDVLIADAGGLEGNKDNVHIAPSELLAVFPEHAWRGTLWTVHSPLTQKARDLQRYEPFDIIELCPYAARKKQAEFFASQLLALGAFRNRYFQIGPAQAERLGRVARTRQFRKGDKILQKHDDVRNPENNKVHIILRGEVSVAEEGREIREGERLGPGDLFGERAIFGAEVAALAYWQIPERRRAKVLTRHEFESGAYFTWNPGLTENDIATEFEQEPDLAAMLGELFRQTQKLQRTRTAVVLTDKTEVMEIKAPEFFKIFEHFVFSAEDLAADEREEKIRETLGALVLSASSASKRMRMDDFIALVELDHLTQVMEPIMEMAQAKLAGDRERIKALKWPPVVFANYTRLDPVSRVIDANLSAFLSFASVFHDQYVSEIEIAPYLDPTRATPEVLTRLVAEGALDGESDRVKAYIARYGNGRKHVKLQRRDVKQLEPFARAIAGCPESERNGGSGVAQENAAKLIGFYQGFPPTQDVLSSLYAEWAVLMSEIDRAYDKPARDPYKDYLARLQTKAIANILTILLYIRMMKAQGKPLPHLDEILLWIHAAWSLDNDWAEQAGMTWGELEQIKPGDIKKDWVALDAVVEQLDFRADFDAMIAQGRARFPSPLHPEV